MAYCTCHPTNPYDHVRRTRRRYCIAALVAVGLLTTTPVVATAQDSADHPAPGIQDQGPAVVAPQQPQLDPGDIQTDAPGPALALADDPLAAQPGPANADQDMLVTARGASKQAAEFLQNGGPSIWVIAALSVVTLALILWKIWRLALIGAWSRGKAGLAVDLFEAGQPEAALTTVRGRRGVRSKVVARAILALGTLPEDRAREDVSRVAKREIAQAGTGLRALELIATIAPLLGLLGTVLGMIAAFQTLQQSGNRADPALLAGGIWEALLTTAAGMAVAIPASAALTWFEAVIDRIRRDVEDGATRLFVASAPQDLKLAAE